MTAAQPDPAAAGLTAGRCDGIAGDAEATTGPPGAGRLDRILAEQAKQDAALNDWATAALADPPPWSAPAGTEVERLRAMVVALEAENAALTDPLQDLTHEWRSPGGVTNDNDCAHLVPAGEVGSRRCSLRPSHPVHRTPARVRAELEEQR